MVTNLGSTNSSEKQQPDLLLLGEEGYHESLNWWQNPETEDPEWITTGWAARTYSGSPFFRHNDRAKVEQWLAENGYHDTGDGAHYRKQEPSFFDYFDHPDAIQPGEWHPF
jgi:hypothetical protein